jgi:luciferase family oxidoreductase group 1
MKLSVVDQSPISSGSNAAEAFQHTIELAQLADRLGYERYWIAEHHATKSLASPAPEIMITRVAAETKRIRVGSGAVLLPYYAPMKVAETFMVLHTLYPGRIDLGLGRAPGGGGLEAYALRRDRSERQLGDDIGEQLAELLAFLAHGHGFPEDHPFARIHLSPDMPGGPEVWMLGSSHWSAHAAAQLGLPYAFAHFINPDPTRDALATYRSRYAEAEWPDPPRTILALGVLCADTDEEAGYLATPMRLRRRLPGTGISGPIPSPEEALAQLATLPDIPIRETSEWPRYIIGSKARVRDQLQEIADAVQTDELMVVTITHSHEARMRSYELLAEAFL